MHTRTVNTTAERPVEKAELSACLSSLFTEMWNLSSSHCPLYGCVYSSTVEGPWLDWKHFWCSIFGWRFNYGSIQAKLAETVSPNKCWSHSERVFKTVSSELYFLSILFINNYDRFKTIQNSSEKFIIAKQEIDDWCFTIDWQ